jgi:hypothetical protein
MEKKEKREKLILVTFILDIGILLRAQLEQQSVFKFAHEGIENGIFFGQANFFGLFHFKKNSNLKSFYF